MFDGVLAIKGSDVRASKSATAIEAKKVKASEVICLAQWILAMAFVIDREEFGSDDESTVLHKPRQQDAPKESQDRSTYSTLETVQTECTAQSPHELSRQR